MKKFLKNLLTVMLVAIMAISFTSCGVPKDPAKAEANLKAEGYITATITASSLGLDDSKVEAIVSASKGILSADSITIVYFANKDDAKSYYEDIKDGDTAKQENYKAGISGKRVWIGHKNAIKAAK